MTTLKVEMPLSSFVAMELMLLTASDAFKASAREMERIGLNDMAANERLRAAHAVELAEKLNAAYMAAATAN